MKEFAEIFRSQCIRAARKGFREASMSGLCADGAMEAAIGAIQSLDIDKILAEYLSRME
ncbi:MAG TPA: hypothetical protein VJ964_04870 [Balneolaceae bacterium]|nr:hypothetical protein [Balneolaceae bacterium]